MNEQATQACRRREGVLGKPGRLRRLLLDEAGRPSRLGHKVGLVRRVPQSAREESCQRGVKVSLGGPAEKPGWLWRCGESENQPGNCTELVVARAEPTRRPQGTPLRPHGPHGIRAKWQLLSNCHTLGALTKRHTSGCWCRLTHQSRPTAPSSRPPPRSLSVRSPIDRTSSGPASPSIRHVARSTAPRRSFHPRPECA